MWIDHMQYFTSNLLVIYQAWIFSTTLLNLPDMSQDLSDVWNIVDWLSDWGLDVFCFHWTSNSIWTYNNNSECVW